VNGSGLEIERKWLLAETPSTADLRALGARAIRIEQVYLRPTAEAPVRRVRSSVLDGRTTWTYTEKAAVSGIVREERERAIDVAEYTRLLREADPDRHPIRKTRHVFVHAGNTLELDVFEQPPGLVVLEIEFDRTDAPEPEIPPELRVVREVSTDPAYLNVNLARWGLDARTS
jgi:CYTH domain-containing protein